MKNPAPFCFRAKLPIAGVVVATLTGALVQSGHASVTGYDFFETGAFTQTSANPSFTTADAMWYGAARVFVSSAGDASSATLQYPDSSTSPLTQNGTLFNYQTGYFGSLSALDNHFQLPGTLTYTISGGALGTQSGSLTPPSSHIYASDIPTFANYSAIEGGVNAGGSFTFAWNSMLANGSANQTGVYFTVVNANTYAPVLPTVALATSATGYSLPANTLAPGQSYFAELYFSDRVTPAGTGFGGLNGLVGNDYETTVQFTTAVPEPTTLVSGALLLLPFGSSAFRQLRKKAQTA